MRRRIALGAVTLLFALVIVPNADAAVTIARWTATIPGHAGGELDVFANGRGAVEVDLTRLKPGLAYTVTLRRGSCTRATTWLVFPPARATAKGLLGREYSLTAAQAKLARSYAKTGLVLRVGNLCGPFVKAPAATPAPSPTPSPTPTWSPTAAPVCDTAHVPAQAQYMAVAAAIFGVMGPVCTVLSGSQDAVTARIYLYSTFQVTDPVWHFLAFHVTPDPVLTASVSPTSWQLYPNGGGWIEMSVPLAWVTPNFRLMLTALDQHGTRYWWRLADLPHN